VRKLQLSTRFTIRLMDAATTRSAVAAAAANAANGATGGLPANAATCDSWGYGGFGMCGYIEPILIDVAGNNFQMTIRRMAWCLISLAMAIRNASHG
jgi:hypothetical protein